MHSLNWAITLALVFGSLNAFSKSTPSDCNEPSGIEEQATDIMKVTSVFEGGGCADASKLKGICNAVSQLWPPPKDSDYDSMAEKMVHDAACVKQGDSAIVIQKKIRAMWSKLEAPYLKCDQSNFEVQYGSILKYSISLMNYDFLGLAVEDWNVNLNTVDKSDGLTVLDFLKEKIDRAKGSKFESNLQYHYKYLRKNGAKHASEL